jgi:hypothetical protein
MQCVNNAIAIQLPTYAPDQDLVLAYLADRMVIAEQVQSGKITIAEAKAQIMQKWSAAVSEGQRRELARQSVAAQQTAANAAVSQVWANAYAANRATMPTSTTCTGSGTYGGGNYSGMTTCNSF